MKTVRTLAMEASRIPLCCTAVRLRESSLVMEVMRIVAAETQTIDDVGRGHRRTTLWMKMEDHEYVKKMVDLDVIWVEMLGDL